MWLSLSSIFILKLSKISKIHLYILLVKIPNHYAHGGLPLSRHSCCSLTANDKTVSHLGESSPRAQPLPTPHTPHNPHNPHPTAIVDRGISNDRYYNSTSCAANLTASKGRVHCRLRVHVVVVGLIRLWAGIAQKLCISAFIGEMHMLHANCSFAFGHIPLLMWVIKGGRSWRGFSTHAICRNHGDLAGYIA